ncbi:MAG: energy-coupling factor ABC transporter ATP-binding protein [Promethearchaeota archaeon]
MKSEINDGAKKKEIIQINDLKFSYPNGPVIFNNLSLSVAENDVVAIIGPNGIGKTTLFFLIMNILKPNKGSIIIDGKPVLKSGEHFVRDKIGFVFQDPNDQLFCPTVWEDLAFGPYNKDITREEIDSIVNDVLDKLKIQYLKDKKPNEISFGEKKIVAFGTVLTLDPDIYILDEPLANLDGGSRKRIVALIQQLHQDGKTIIFSTHDTLMASMLANTVIVLQPNENAIMGPANTILRNFTLLNSIGVNTNPISELFWRYSRENNPVSKSSRIPITIDEALEFLKELASKGSNN